MARWLRLLLVIPIAAVIGGLPSWASDSAGQAVAGPAATLRSDDPVADPFPIRRIRATESHAPALLKQLDAGPLVRLPRTEFEARVRAAGRAAADAKVIPRIIDTRFTATLVGGDLVGTAELDVLNPAPTPRFLPLDPLRLALGPAMWDDGREAVVGIPNRGGSLAVWVDRPGRQTIRFAWSLSGIEELGERRFELRVPAAAAATLSLDLPTGQVPTVSASDLLLTGPFSLPGEPQRARWQFRFGGRPRLDFAVRSTGNPGVIAAAALAAKYDLAPGLLTCRFEYDLRPAKGTLGEWLFTVDPALRITDVVVNNRAGWTVEAPTVPAGPRLLRVMLRQPGAGGKVLVSAVAPFPDRERPADSPLPVVRPVNANLDDEAIEIHFAPGQKLETWHAGDYRLTDAQQLADQSRSFSLIGTMLPPGVDRLFRHMPTLRIAAAEADYTTMERLTWRLGMDRATASLHVAVRVRRGALFELAMLLPESYPVSRVGSSPDDLIAHHDVAGRTTRIEFARPIMAGQSAEFDLELNGPALSPAPQSLPFPTVDLLGTTERVGLLAIVRGSLWAIDPSPGPSARPLSWLDFAEPREPVDAAVAYRFRGASADGILRLSPARAEFSANISSTTRPIPGGRIDKDIFAIHLHTGALATVAIAEPDADATQRSWHVVGGGNAVASAVVLPLAAWANPFHLVYHPAGTAMSGGPARVWLIRFARPVTADIGLEAIATRRSPVLDEAPGPGAWSVLGATPDANNNTSRTPKIPSGPLAREWKFSSLYLVTAVRSPTDIVVIFGGTVDSLAGTSLPLRLPGGAAVRAAAIGGRWLEPANCRLSEDGVLRLPVAVSGATRFEIRYRLPPDVRGRVRSPEPEVPVERPAIGRWWVFGNDVLPGWPFLGWHRGQAADLPPFLGDSPASWAGGLIVSRTAVDEVRVGAVHFADSVGFCVLAALVALVWPASRRTHSWLAIAVVGIMLALGATSLLAPPWWQHAAVIPLSIGLVVVAAMVVVRGSRLVQVAVLVAVTGALTQSDLPAQLSPPALVVVLPPDAEGREFIVAPKTVLDQLIVMPHSPGVVLSSSNYAMTADAAGARVVATYIVNALDDGPAVATLSLADARLEKVTVNKATAFPVAPRPGIYSIPLPGRGRHEIEIVSTVPFSGTGSDRELRFGVPECPVTRLAVDLPGTARQVQVVGRIGRQTMTGGDRVQLQAEVGAVKSLHIRWREGGEGQATVKVREGCIWDLTETGAELTACYLARVEPGTISSLQFSIPAELDVLGVTARSLDPAGVAALREWTLGKEATGFRPLQIDFQGPTSGRVLVVLTASPRKTITRQPILRFPKPTISSIVAEPDAAYALRTKGLTIEDPGRSGMIDFAPDALTRDFGGVAELRLDPNVPVRVFRPTPGRTPELHPTLRLLAEPPHATLETTWYVGPTRAEANGIIRWNGKDAPPLVEFLLPGVKVVEVRGAEVASWAQVGSRTQVWFRRPVREGEIEWIGTTAVHNLEFDAHAPRLEEMHLLGDTLRIQATEGYAPRIERDRGWMAVRPGADGMLVFSTTNLATQPVRVRLVSAERPASPIAPARPQPVQQRSTPPVDELGPRPSAIVPAAAPLALPDAPSWVWPVSAAVGWLAATTGLAFLLVRFPGSTWPEQLGIVVSLWGAAVFGHWWLGVVAWLLARTVYSMVSRTISSSHSVPAEQ